MIVRIRTTALPIAAVEIWLVGLLVAAGVATTRALPFALAVAASFWLVRWLATGRLSVRTPGDWAIGLLALTIPVTLWATALPDVTRPQVLRLATGVALYYAVVNWATTMGRLQLLGLGLASVGLLLALSAPFSVQWIAAGKLLFIPEAIYRRLPLLLPDPIHPNVMAGTLAQLLPVALALLLFAWSGLPRVERVLLVAAGLLMAGVLVLTKSRGGLMGFAAGLVVLVASRWRRGWLAIPIGAVAAGLVVWRLGFGRVLDALATAQAIGGLEDRLEVWSRAIFMTQDFPFTGIGMGTFRQVANLLYPFFLAGPDADISHAHNLFLQVAVDLGLPGLIAWLALFLLVCLAGWRVCQWGRADQGNAGESKPRLFMAGLGAGILGSQVALAVHGLIDAVTWGTRPAVLVWAVWGVAFAAWNLTQAAGQDMQRIR